MLLPPSPCVVLCALIGHPHLLPFTCENKCGGEGQATYLLVTRFSLGDSLGLCKGA